MMPMHMRDAKMHVADARQHGESERALEAMMAVNHLMRRQHAEDAGADADRERETEELRHAAWLRSDAGSPQGRRELQGNVEPGQAAMRESALCVAVVDADAERCVQADEDDDQCGQEHPDRARTLGELQHREKDERKTVVPRYR